MRTNMISCIKTTDTSVTHDQNADDENNSFFYRKNYRRIIQCLNDGYKVSMNLIQSMEDYHNLLQNNVHRCTSFSKKWRLKLNQQSSLSSYHTTKRAQIDTIRSFETLGLLLQTRCDAIQQVIDTYKDQVKQMYPSKRLGTVHKHYQSEILEELFKTAYSPLSKLLGKLDKLDEEKETVEEALQDVDIQCDNQTTNKEKQTRAYKKQKKRQDKLDKIKTKICQLKDEYHEEQEIYYERAYEIYQKSRKFEEERLNQIRETLINFLQVAHTSEYSIEYNAIFQNLLTNIQNQQDSTEDLNFWAHTYHVYTTNNDDDDIQIQTEDTISIQEESNTNDH